MLSTSSYSKTIIKENISRYWAISVLGYVGYFLVGIMPVLMNFKSFRSIASYAESTMNGNSFSVNAIIVTLAVIASAAVFGYLHEQPSSNAMHSMPTDRGRLFRSAIISGWILMIIPLVLFAFSMLFLRGASSPAGAMNEESIMDLVYGGNTTAKEIYSLPHAFGFILTSIISASYAFAVSCLAAVLAGKKVIHVLLSLFIFILPPALVLTFDGLCSEYLFGFKETDINYGWLNATIAAMMKEDFEIQVGFSVFFIIITLALLAASLWIYKKIKLERIGNSTTFPLVGDVLVVLLTLLSTIGFANIFALMIGNDNDGQKGMRFAIAAVISSAIYFAVMRMIADSSPAIFNLKNLKKYLLCLGILLVILAFTAFDITNYGKKVPAPDEVASVHIDTSFPNGLYNIDEDCTDPSAIESLLELQQAIIDERNVEFKKNDEGYEDYSTETFILVWKLKNGKEISRKYDAVEDENHTKTGAALKNLYNTSGFRNLLTLNADEEIKRCKNIGIYNAYSEDEPEVTNIKKADWEGLIGALNEDLAGASYEQMANYCEWEDDQEDRTDCYTVDLSYRAEDDSAGKSYVIREKDKNTVEYLKGKGYIK